MKKLKLSAVGISLVLVILTCLPAVANARWVYGWTQVLDLPRLLTYAEGRRNVQIFGDVGEYAKDVYVKASVMTWPGRHAGLVFRCDAHIKYYYEILINEHRDELALLEYRDGKARELKKIKIPGLKNSRYYELAVQAEGNKIWVWFDRKLRFSVVDNTPLSQGYTGVSTYHTGAWFQDFESWEKN